MDAGRAELIKMKMTCYTGTGGSPNRQAGSRSVHVGGVYVCLCDGSVHWISDNIETSGTSLDSHVSFRYLSVWDRLNLSSDGQPAAGTAF